jgi:hypothetical protein
MPARHRVYVQNTDFPGASPLKPGGIGDEISARKTGKKMILCADDFGIRADVNEAILDLVARGRLSAVSCLVNYPGAEDALWKLIRQGDDRIDIGLHFNFTEGIPAAPPPDIPTLVDVATGQFTGFGRLHAGAWRGRFPASELRREMEMQYGRFVEVAGRPPDHIDGYLHVHQFPGVGETMMAFLASLPADAIPRYVRNTGQPWRFLKRQGRLFLKAAFIGFYGHSFRRYLLSQGWRTNDGFAGVYNVRRRVNYGRLFQRFVECLPEANGVLVTHPGQAEPWRRAEYITIRDAILPAGLVHRFRL